MQYPVFSQLLWVWLLSSHFPGEGRSQQPERMKLCGREFIRTVIYTCGSSRWRRLSLDQQMDRQAQPAESVLSFISKDVEPDKLKSALNPGVEELQGIFTQKKLKDLFDLDSDHESLPMSENLKTYIDQLKEYSETSQGEGEATNPLEPSNFSWVKHPRKKRDFSLASYCCTYTCTKADIAKAC